MLATHHFLDRCNSTNHRFNNDFRETTILSNFPCAPRYGDVVRNAPILMITFSYPDWFCKTMTNAILATSKSNVAMYWDDPQQLIAAISYVCVVSSYLWWQSSWLLSCTLRSNAWRHSLHRALTSFILSTQGQFVDPDSCILCTSRLSSDVAAASCCMATPRVMCVVLDPEGVSSFISKLSEQNLRTILWSRCVVGDCLHLLWRYT